MIRLGELSRAEECVRRGLNCDPGHLKLSLIFSSLLTKQEKYLEAFDFLSGKDIDCHLIEVVLAILRGLANLPGKPPLSDGESPLPLASQLMDMMDTVFAEQLLAQEQMAHGETAEVLFMFGRLYRLLRDSSKAASFLTRSAALTESPEALLLLGHVEYERGRLAECVKWYEKGLDLKFEHDAALRLGFAQMKLGENDEAEKVLFKCSPQSASVLLGLGVTAMRMEKWKQADLLLNKATVVNHRHPEIWGNLALFSFKVGRVEEAMHAVGLCKKWNLSDEDLKKELIGARLWEGGEEEVNDESPEEESLSE
jgi:tetratricopeptide (TPR) repeat protein